MESEYYLLQGFFFQPVNGLAIAFDPKEGPFVIIGKGLVSCMFAGAIWPSAGGDPHELVGVMKDTPGDASLKVLKLTDEYLIFEKVYEHRDDTILYTFQKDAETGVWYGGYTGDAVGEGQAWCVLTPIPKAQFDQFPRA